MTIEEMPCSLTGEKGSDSVVQFLEPISGTGFILRATSNRLCSMRVFLPAFVRLTDYRPL
jgi:hypothetical protein